MVKEPIVILCIAGARPNFMKVAPLLRALREDPAFSPKLVHTGQHYDEAMSKVFFEDLKIPRPDVELEVGSGSHAVQTAEIMKRFEPVLEREQPQAVIVVGDVNSTIGCALVSAKFHLRKPYASRFGVRTRPLVVHVEAGLRSGDPDMPEEINRVLTDAISDLLYVSDPSGMKHLAREGVADERCIFVGNVMIDTLLAAKEQAMRSPVLGQQGLTERGYALLTLHRPGNVDDAATLASLLRTLDDVAKRIPIVFPVHPRTRAKLGSTGVALDPARWKITDPFGYLDFLRLTSAAAMVLTDSGGIQEETTVLGVPCLTLRPNTERPVTIEEGTNFLVGSDRAAILSAVDTALSGGRSGRVPRFWDGQTARRIVTSLREVFAVA